MRFKKLQNNRLFIIGLFVLLLNVLAIGSAHSQTWKLIQPAYPTTGTFVAGFSVADYGAVGDGVTDVTSIFQDRLDALGALGGGTLFVPAGKYVIKGTLLIPKGITLRGEWQKPVKGQPIAGTILMAYAGKGDENAAAFITMETSAAVMDLAIWYPEQDATSITPYPPSILFGKPNYFGNEFCNAKNITLVNAYSGIIFSRANGGTCPVINGIYGTPLSRGVEIDNIVDVGRIEWIDFSPAYWSGSGLPNSPAAGSAFEGWLLQNGTGIVMRRNDWSYAAFVSVEGYNIGFHAAPSIASVGATPNGHNYDMTFTNCKTGIFIEADNNVGNMFTRINIVNCNTGVEMGAKTSGAIQFHSSTIDAGSLAINTESGSTSRLLLQHCTIVKGRVNIAGSTFNASDCDFNNSAPQIVIEKDSRAIITANRFKNAVQIKNTSVFVSTIDHTPINLTSLPDFPQIAPETHRPAKQVMFLATAAPYNAVPNGSTDNTNALQAALDAAGSNGGGVVFLPPGKYKVLGNLNVPTGVELKGSVDVSTSPTGPGSVLEVYAGKGSATGTPFLKLAANSGIRGITFDYPEQVASLLPSMPAYPYCIQGAGSNVYIINVGIRAAYNGIDLFTYKCDNHFVDFFAGHAFNNGIKVGSGSTGGKIYNLQFNTIIYAAGSESKFGSWPNSPTGSNTAVYDYGYANLKFLILGDVKNQILYNDFIFGSNKGIVLSAENGTGPNGISLGLGVDGTRNALNFDAAGTSGFNFINTQVVAYGDTTTRYITTGPDFKSQVTLFSSDYWGNPGRGLIVNSGTVTLQTANFNQPGQLELASVKTGGKVNIENSAIWPAKLASNGSEARISARSSIIDSTGVTTKNTLLWQNNLGNPWSIIINGDLDRKDWTATASVNNGSTRNALDSIASTRWDSQGSQQNGQWFTVDMKTMNTVDKIILDASASPDDSPAGYEVYLSADGVNWGSAVATGQGTNSLTIIDIASLKGRYIKIVQTGTKSNYWSIHEFRVFGKVDVASITVSPATVSLIEKSTKQLTGTIAPVTATDKIVTWSSSDNTIATVDSKGMVTAIAPGKVFIKVITEDGAKKDSSTVTVTSIPPASISVTGVSITTGTITLDVNAAQTLTAIIAPGNATNKNVIWSSNNNTIATVSATGVVTAKAAGTAIITATTEDGAKTTICTVTVNNLPQVAVTGVNISAVTATLEINGTKQLTATITPSNAANKNITWSSANSAVATVSANGLVTAISAGTAVITATSEDGSKTAICTVTVKGNSTTGNITGVVFYPNPLSGVQINIRMPDQQSGQFTVRFTNLLGQILQSSVISMSNGTGAFTLKQKHIPGIYQLELVNQSTQDRIAKKIILQ
jgi:uncharacterized protein YjdB